MYIASFDIGKVNFAFCIERVDEKKLESIKSIPKIRRYNKGTGTQTDEFIPILDEVCVEGEIVLYKNVDLTKGTTSKEYLSDEVLVNMYKVLDEYAAEFERCSVLIIEQQMSFGLKKINTMALKLGQHCRSYFIYKYRNTKETIEFPAYHKTQVFGARKMTKPERKKWSVDKCANILLQRGDLETLNILSEAKKRDDLADVFTQLQAFKFLRFVSKDI
jgi:hypothetical protein